MSDGEVRYVREGNVATVTFDRPQARNAMTWRMYEQLGEACARIEREDGLRAAVFRGAGGKAFIAGTDIAQFRAFPAKPPIPPDQDWRTLEVQLNQAMQNPFIPGDTLKPGDKQVTLQVVETEAEPKTVIRYIVTPAPPTGSQLAVGSSQ